jgi:predicted deacylase
MAITGTNSANQRMKIVCEELEVNGVVVTPAAQAEAIADITVTGTYATDDDAIEAAVNGILAVLRAHGMVASS